MPYKTHQNGLRPTFSPDFQHENKEKGWPQVVCYLFFTHNQ